MTGFCGNLDSHSEIITTGKDAELNEDFSYVPIFLLDHVTVSANLLFFFVFFFCLFFLFCFFFICDMVPVCHVTAILGNHMTARELWVKWWPPLACLLSK